jgi:hypothetical protein
MTQSRNHCDQALRGSSAEAMIDAGEIIVSDRMQSDYRYRLTAPMGEDFSDRFNPHFSPKTMLEMGVFEGRYLTDCVQEFPQSWFEKAKLSPVPDPALNFFRVKSRQSLSVWKEKGWIYGPDPRGWFQWYCRYFLGRRIERLDEIQISRWRGFARHAGQIRANCCADDISCRPRQRQALLQWAYDPFF